MSRKLLILSAVFCILLTSCGQKKNEVPQDTTPGKRVMTVSTQKLSVPYTAPTQIRGKEDIEIYPQVAGTLEGVLVVEGQSVKKGQKMFLINATAYQAAVENATASVVLASANVETHKIELEATKQLYLKRVVAEHQYKVHANNLAVAQAQLDEAEAIQEGRYTSYIAEGTYMDMMYMPDALQAIVDLMEADPAKLVHRNAFNISAMSFEPSQIAKEIQKHLPTFTMDYEVDPVRQAIANSWPNSIDSAAAIEEWGFKASYDLEKMTADMLEKLKIRLDNKVIK